MARALPFAQLPSSIDWPRTDEAAAAIQSMQPLPDGSGRLAVSDLRGQLYIVDATGNRLRLYLDIAAQGFGFHYALHDAGLLGFAFHPQFGQPGAPGYGKLYTAFNVAADSGDAAFLDQKGPGGNESVIREWSAADPAADTFQGTSREVLRVGQPKRTTRPRDVHGVGTLAFNPTANEGSTDFGLLYVGYGDGGHDHFGQDLAVPLGAILRIDPLGRSGERGYRIPTDNPFVDTPGAAGEIWAYGLRHPQRFSWDSDGRLFIADIGHRQIEEVNLGIAGGNFGWQLREGTFATKWGGGGNRPDKVYERPPTDAQSLVYPIAQYDRDEGFAIGGGFVYRGKGIPALRGKYVFTDIVRGRVFVLDAEDLRPGAIADIEELRLLFDGEERDVAEVAAFATTEVRSPRVDLRLGIDGHGELYLLTKGDGRIRKLVAPADERAESVAEADWQAPYRRAYLEATAGAPPVFSDDVDIYRAEKAIVFVDESCAAGELNRRPEITVHSLDTGAKRIPPLSRFAAGARVGSACVWRVELPDYAIAQIDIHGAGKLREAAFLEQLRQRYAALVAKPPIARSVFDTYMERGKLTYVKAPCRQTDTDARFFLHVRPIDADDLPDSIRRQGFKSLDFRWGEPFDAVFDGVCMATRQLPDFAIASIATGQYRPGESELWRSLSRFDSQPGTEGALGGGARGAGPRMNPHETPLVDPMPAKIAKGGIVAAAVPFAELPSSMDWPKTDEAVAAVQAMQPIPDGSGRLAVADQRGILYVANAAADPLRPYLDLRRQGVDFRYLSFEIGFKGFAFHPQFGKPGKPGYGKLYTAFNVAADSGEAAYSDQKGAAGREAVIREWRAVDPTADVFDGTSREVLRIGHRGLMHSIGTIAFNPNAGEGSVDHGLLYVGIGDGADPRAGQDIGLPLAAILRIDPLGGGSGRGYGIPADNPFVAAPGAAAEIWAYGLRHPQHFSWAGDGRLFIADIGDEQIEEVNLGVAGGNFGWRLREGTFATKWGGPGAEPHRVYARPPRDEQSFIYPVAQYDHDEGFAIGGGFVYQGKGIPALRGKYVFTDIVRGRVFFFEAENLRPQEPSELADIEELRLLFDGEERDIAEIAGFATAQVTHTLRRPKVRSPRVDLRLGVDGDGELYLLTKGDGRIRKLVAPADERARSVVEAGWRSAYRQAYAEATASAPVFSDELDIYHDGRDDRAIVFVDESCGAGGLNRKPVITAYAMDAGAKTIPPLTRFAPGARIGRACVWRAELPNYAIAHIDIAGLGGVRRLNDPAYLEWLRQRYAALTANAPTARAIFDLHVDDGKLTYVKSPCRQADTEAPFFLHVVPASIDDLPSARRPHGFENLDFRWGAPFDSIFPRASSTVCMATRQLPGYAIASIATGQHQAGEADLWRTDIRCSARRGMANPCRQAASNATPSGGMR